LALEGVDPARDPVFYSGHDQGGHVQPFYWPICPHWPMEDGLDGLDGGLNTCFLGRLIWIVVFST